MSNLALKHHVTAARLAAMHGQACMPRSIIKTWICCIPKTNTVDKNISSSNQVNWSSTCCHLTVWADLVALNVVLRREVAKYTRLKNYKLSSLAVYTEGTQCTIFLHEIQVQGKLNA